MGVLERKAREKQQKRDLIIQAAEAIFFTEGLSNASMDSIAKQAEIGKGTLYLYFKSKDELYRAILQKAFDLLEEHFNSYISPSNNGYQHTLTLIQAYIDFSRIQPNYFEAILHYQNNTFDFNHLEDEPENAKAAQAGADLMMKLVNAIEQGKKDKSISSVLPPQETAFVIWGQVTGVLQIIKKKMNLVEYVSPLKTEDLLHTQMLFIEKTLKP